MARYRGAPNRPADVLVAQPAELRVFRPGEWSRPADVDDPSGPEASARRRWLQARFAFAARWGVSRVEVLMLERDDRNRMREESTDDD